MERARTAITAAFAFILIVTDVGSSVSAIDQNADASAAVRAARRPPITVALDPASRQIVVVGDSVLFTRLAEGSRSNEIVPLAQRAVRLRHPGITVSNRSYPGLSTLHTIDDRSPTLRPYLMTLLDADGPPPDVVVVAISSIDINLFPDIAVAALAPALISELRAIDQLLAARGIDAVFVPPFGINGNIYNNLRGFFEPYRDYRFDERVNKYTALLRESGLPLLFDRFAGLDQNGDGNADRRYFVDNDPLRQWPDDGIHPNALGERVFGDNLASGLVAALERG
jgi:lysophospholipase L1-like esterase